MYNAVLFKSEKRFEAFYNVLIEKKVKVEILDFEKIDWINFDYSGIDLLIYFPTFYFTSNHPLALQKVYDNLAHIHLVNPSIVIFPDPNIIQYYNDKYKQFLFLKSFNYPIPDTIPLLGEEAVDIADNELGYPMVVKNRYGAGGGSVFKVHSKKELMKFYKFSKFDFFNIDALKYFLKFITRRGFYYYLIKERKIEYPFFSIPMLAQKFVELDRDLKIVVGDYKVVEGHWRLKADKNMWKVNIDGGGIGEWSYIPPKAIELAERLAKDLNTKWLNVDMIMKDEEFLITEFSPVWHHYAYKEKPSFVYKDDYNIEMPLEVSLNLERIIVESLIREVDLRRKRIKINA
ncbi:MAG: ATP-grasp domain-containing protein [Candidatus Helarchaeota archaeon]